MVCSHSVCVLLVSRPAQSSIPLSLSFFSFPQKKNTMLRPQDKESRDASRFSPHFPDQLGKPWFMLELSQGLCPEESPSDQSRTPGWTVCPHPLRDLE